MLVTEINYTDLDLLAPIGFIYNELARAGFDVKQISSQEFKICCDQRKGRVVSPPFDEIYHDFTEGNSIFLIAMDKNNDLAATLAVRNDSLGTTTLGQMFAKQFSRTFDGKQNGQYAPIAHEIRGNVSYHGDFWVHQRFAKQGLTFLMPRLALLLTLNKFRPDFVYSLIRTRIINLNFHNKAGFTAATELAIGWQEPPKDLGEDLYLVYSTARDLRWLAFNEFSRNRAQTDR